MRIVVCLFDHFRFSLNMLLSFLTSVGGPSIETEVKQPGVAFKLTLLEKRRKSYCEFGKIFVPQVMVVCQDFVNRI